MIITFIWPSTFHYSGGVRVMWELANAMARRGHDVHFVHGPAWPERITHVDQLPPFAWDPRVHHHIVDTLDDPSLPAGDVVFPANAPRRLGEPAVLVQGYRMVAADVEHAAFRARAPKVCVASWLTDIARMHGSRPEQLWYIPLGMDHEMFSVRRPLDDRPYDVALLFNSHGQKGWRVGRDALYELFDERPATRAVVFGIYAPEDELPRGVELQVGLDQQRLADEVYNSSKVFLQSSYNEGFGYTAVEAMACGAALVTTDNGGSRDYAIDTETALVVEQGDSRGLADAVATLLANEPLRFELAEAGEKLVRRFDWALAAEELERRLEEYLADPEALQGPPFDDETTA